MQSLALFALSGIFLGCAWLSPGTLLCALLGWIAVILLLIPLFSDTKRPYLGAYFSGVVATSIGFYWLRQTVVDFSGFPPWYGTLVFSAFTLFTALQFLIFVYFLKQLLPFLGRIALASPCAWITSEFLSLRIFPWEVGHTQLAATHFVQICDIFGSPGVTFLMFWCAEALLSFLRLNSAPGKFLKFTPALVLLGALYYGSKKIEEFTPKVSDRPVKIAIIQANITVEEKHNVKYFAQNTERYAELSRKLLSDPNKTKPALVIWPESSIVEALPDRLQRRQELPGLDALIPPEQNYLLGSITVGAKREMYNSAIPILADGSILYPYHKRILMPFGEYMPFEDLIPSLRSLNDAVGDFEAGTGVSIFDYSNGDRRHTPLLVSPLICYEDIVPSLATEATKAGATLLVNLTNDAWFGKSAAPHQHNLIASFRAIENRRYLVRSTNSGLTAVISPLGQTVSQIPTFSDGILESDVFPISQQSFLTRFDGRYLWWIIVSFACCVPLYFWSTKE